MKPWPWLRLWKATRSIPLRGAFAPAQKSAILTLPVVHGFEAIQGRGAMAHSSSHMLYVGGPRLLEMLNIQLPEALSDFEQSGQRKRPECGASGATRHDGSQPEAVASFALADVIRPESREAVRNAARDGRAGGHADRRQPGRGQSRGG